MRIRITEDKLMLLRESQEEVTFYGFLTALQKFMRSPFGDPDKLFLSHGINRDKLLNGIEKVGLMTKKDSIDERQPEGQEKKQAFFTRTYKPTEEDFQKKAEKLYKSLFPDGRLLEGKLFEAGATACGSIGAVSGPLNSGEGNGYEYDVPFGMQRRSIYSPRKKKKRKRKDVDMRPALRRGDGRGGSISIPKRRR